MTLPQTLMLGGGLTVAVFGAGVLVGRHSNAPPVSVQVAHAITQIRDTAQAHADTVYVRNDHWLTKTLQHFDTIQAHDTILKHLTDTVMVQQYVAACDSLRGSCQAFRDSSQLLRSADHALIQAQSTELRAWQSSQPSTFRRIATSALIGAAGFGLCKTGITLPFPH